MENKDDLQIFNELIKVHKPKLFLPIWTTVMCSGPPLKFFINYFIYNDIQNSTNLIIMTTIAITYLTLVWYLYVKEKKEFKKYEKRMLTLMPYLISEEKCPFEDELIKLHDIADTISKKEYLKKLKSILDSIED